MSPAASLLRAWAAILLAPAALWTAVLDETCMVRRERLRQHRVQLMVASQPPSGVAASTTNASVRAAADVKESSFDQQPSSPSHGTQSLPQVAKHALWPRSASADAVTVLLALPTPCVMSEAAETAHVSDGADAPALAIDLLLPLPTMLQWELPAIRLHVPKGCAIVMRGHVRWRIVEGGTCVIFDYRPETDSSLADNPSLPLQRFALQVLDEVSATLRAAFALAASPPSARTTSSEVAGGSPAAQPPL